MNDIIINEKSKNLSFPENESKENEKKELLKSINFTKTTNGNDIEWKSNDIQKPIIMTVALPALNSENIIWLAMTSLKYQRNIGFNWELIIWEEFAKSRKVIEFFVGKLRNCKRIVHKYINPKRMGRTRGSLVGKFLLIDKWRGIANQSSHESKIFVLHAADCFSPPNRLAIHYRHFLNKKCFFSTQVKGTFFNINTGKTITYNGRKIDENLIGNHLNMAIRTKDMKKIPSVERNKGIDGFILANIRKMNNLKKTPGHIFPDTSIIKDNWKYSLDTDGHNNISIKRKYNYIKPGPAYEKSKLKIINTIPGNVLLYLNDLRVYGVPKFTKIYNELFVKSKYKYKYVNVAKKLRKKNKISEITLQSFIKYINTKVPFLF